MASILEKLRVLTLGNLHQLLDAAIDLNSVAACKQYVRDLETSKDKMRNLAAEARGSLGITQGQVATLQHQIETDTEHAQLLLSDDDASNDGDAQTLMEGVILKQDQLTDLQTLLTTQTQAANALGDAVRKITTRLAEMQNNVARLERLERTASAQELATASLKQASAVMGSADGVSVDSVSARLEHRAATANEGFKDSMTDMSDGSAAESVTSARAKALIAKMRSKGDGSAATGTSAAAQGGPGV